MRTWPKYLCLLAFVVLAYVLLPVMNGDYLYTIQDNSAFIGGHTFMADMVGTYGWLTWVSCYLTQFFYHPWLGSTIIIAMWAAIYLLSIHLFGIPQKLVPLALILPLLLLFNLLDYGYWIYYVKPGFPFQLTLMVLLNLFCTWGFLLVVRLIPTVTPHKGRYAIPLFVVMLAMSFLFCPHAGRLFQHHSSFLITTSDKNFRHELNMYRAVDDVRYDDCIQEMASSEGTPTNLMVLLKNISLMHTGRLKELFKTSNCGTQPTRNEGDTLQVQLSQLAAPLVYYQFGQINYAYRWAMENSVEKKLSFRNLKMMAKCAIFNKEYDVAMKYLTLLKTSIFHRQWAKEHEGWVLNRETFTRSSEYQAIAPLLNDDQNMLDTDNGLCEKYILEHFSDLIHPTSQKLEDVIMCLALWSEDEYAFCVHFYNFLQRHQGQPVPGLYQEAAIMLCTAERSPVQLNNFPFDRIIADRYNRFVHDYNTLSAQGLDEQETARRMHTLYGDTYWWYYYFYTGFHVY